MSHSTNKTHRGTLLCSTKILVSKKNHVKEEVAGVSRFSVRKSWWHTVEIVRREILECFIKFRNRKTSCMRGVHQDFCRFFLWRTSKKLRRGILLCFRNILIWKNFLDKKVGRGWSIICLREKFLSHSGEKVRRKILQCFIHFGYRNTL